MVVGGEGPEGLAAVVVVPDGGGEGEEALDDAGRDALVKLLYLGCREIGRTDRGNGRGGRNGYVWMSALNQLEIMYPDRLRLA